ncbi:MAG: hypothetical protein K2N13_07730 [Paraprevotella sp.]|nr:hypothetical protein [Paraprevotella sp.]
MKKMTYTAPACEVTPVRMEGMLASSTLTPGGDNIGILPGDSGYDGEFNSNEWEGIWSE